MQGSFNNREDAGNRLAQRLGELHFHNPLIFALPRGGVPVGFRIAKLLHAPLDVVLVRKIGAPMNRELAIGAVTDGQPPYVFIDRHLAASLGVSQHYIDEEISRQIAEIERRRELYEVAAAASLVGKTAIAVDDGIATGATMRVALQSLKQRKPDRLVLAVPVAAEDALAELQHEVDDIVCLTAPLSFYGVGAFYRDFSQVDDSIVIDLLRRSRAALQRPQAGE